MACALLPWRFSSTMRTMVTRRTASAGKIVDGLPGDYRTSRLVIGPPSRPTPILPPGSANRRSQCVGAKSILPSRRIGSMRAWAPCLLVLSVDEIGDPRSGIGRIAGVPGRKVRGALGDGRTDADRAAPGRLPHRSTPDRRRRPYRPGNVGRHVKDPKKTVLIRRPPVRSADRTLA